MHLIAENGVREKELYFLFVVSRLVVEVSVE